MNYFETLVLVLLECLMFGMGILYGWVSKQRYPGNPERHVRESKIYDKGYNRGIKVGIEYGKKRMVEDLLIYKTKMEEEK